MLADNKGKKIIPVWHSGDYPPAKIQIQLSGVQRLPYGNAPLSQLSDAQFASFVEELAERIAAAGCAPEGPAGGTPHGAGPGASSLPSGLTLLGSTTGSLASTLGPYSSGVLGPPVVISAWSQVPELSEEAARVMEAAGVRPALGATFASATGEAPYCPTRPARRSICHSVVQRALACRLQPAACGLGGSLPSPQPHAQLVPACRERRRLCAVHAQPRCIQHCKLAPAHARKHAHTCWVRVTCARRRMQLGGPHAGHGRAHCVHAAAGGGRGAAAARAGGRA